MKVPGERATLLRDVRSGEVTMAFRCTRCAAASVAWVPPEQLDRLLARGFAVRDLVPPAELTEPRPVADPFTHDDLLAAHELLASTDRLVELLDDGLRRES